MWSNMLDVPASTVLTLRSQIEIWKSPSRTVLTSPHMSTDLDLLYFARSLSLSWWQSSSLKLAPFLCPFLTLFFLSGKGLNPLKISISCKHFHPWMFSNRSSPANGRRELITHLQLTCRPTLHCSCSLQTLST